MRGLQLAARFAALPVAVFSAVLCWLWLQATVLAGGAPPQPPSPPPSGVLGTRTVHASPLGGYTCVAGQWQFYLTAFAKQNDAPKEIYVSWANGVKETVSLSGFAQGTAYFATANPTTLSSTVSVAEAEVDAGWNGAFSILQGPCEDVAGIVSQNIPVVPASAVYPALALAAAGAAHTLRRRRALFAAPAI